MIIGIDAREIQAGVYTGIGRALHNFLHFFEQLEDEHRCVLFSTQNIPLAYGTRIATVVAPHSGPTLIWDQCILPCLVKKSGAGIFYSPYYKIPLAASIPTISTIFDLMYLYYPIKWRGTDHFTRWYYRIFGGMMVAKARRIFTCSEYSKNEIIRFYHVPNDKVCTIHLGLSEQYRPATDRGATAAVLQKLGITAPYLLYTGNFKPHKNIPLLIESFEKIKRTVSDLQLVLAGNRDRNFDRIGERIATSPCAPAILSTGLVSLDEQVALYNGAAVFVFPSLYEGFGYPPLEAMACGAPVVSSARTSLDEIIGDAALRCDPTSSSDIAEKTVAVLQSEALRQKLSARGPQRAHSFTNEAFCNRFYTLLLSTR